MQHRRAYLASSPGFLMGYLHLYLTNSIMNSDVALRNHTLSIYRLVAYLFLLEYLVSALPRYLKEDKFFKENTLYKDCYQVRELLQEVLSKLEVKV